MLQLCLEMMFVFAMIGLFCFGGGYGILPFIQGEVIGRGWMEIQEFINIIAVSESTPGPLGINVATYVGFKMGGLLGATSATVGLMLPAFFLVLLVTRILPDRAGRTCLGTDDHWDSSCCGWTDFLCSVFHWLYRFAQTGSGSRFCRLVECAVGSNGICGHS